MHTRFRNIQLVLAVALALTCLGHPGAFAQAGLGQGTPEAFTRNYQWIYKGEKYQATLSFEWKAYNFYKEHRRVYDAYAIYTYENPAHYYLKEVVKVLERKARAHRLSRWETLEMVTSFVQQLEYVREEGEYPKFPMETLAEKGGDCEDTSLLLASLLRTMGYDVILVNPPGHMSVALACSDCEGNAYHRNGRKYYYIETTAPGFAIGEIPREYQATRDRLFDLNSPLVRIRLMNEHSGLQGDRMPDYYVQEDGATSKVCPQTGECVLLTRSIRNVIVNGEKYTSSSVMRWIE